MRVKICGITRLEDARLAMDLGAWALGFIFYEKSPRYIAPRAVRAILDSLPPSSGVRSVGVFVNASEATIREVASLSGVDTIQLHGDEDVALCERLQEFKVWKAIRLKQESQFQEARRFTSLVEAVLYDASVPGQYGGTGHRVDWDLLSKAPREIPLIVSGGLNADNVSEADRRFHPFALDLSSGVEQSPGLKDHKQLTQLFARKG